MAQKGCFVCGSRVLLSAQISKRFGYKGSQCESLEHAFQLCKQQLPFSCVPQIAGFRYARRIDHLRGCNMAYWKEDAIKVNGYNEDLLEWGHEDAEFAYRLHLLAFGRRR